MSKELLAAIEGHVVLGEWGRPNLFLFPGNNPRRINTITHPHLWGE